MKDKSFRVIIDLNSKNDPGGLFKFKKVHFVCLQLFKINVFNINLLYNLEVHENLKNELIKNKNMRMYASFLTSAVFLLVSFKRALEAAR